MHCQVLACAGRRHFAIPLTYRGQFERRRRKFAGSRQLLNEAQPSSVVCVAYLDRGENLPLSIGDRLKVLSNDDKKLFVRCERYYLIHDIRYSNTVRSHEGSGGIH